MSGLAPHGWTAGVWDTAKPGIDRIVQRSVAKLHAGAILLLHDADGSGNGDDRSQTVAALPQILAAGKQKKLIGTFDPTSLATIQVNGLAGNDTIIVNPNITITTIIDGGVGNDFIVGGGGSNVFVFEGANHVDCISDFNATMDKLQFQPALTAGNQQLFSTAVISVADFMGNTIVNFDGNAITLDGVRAASLQTSNFISPPGTDIKLMVDQTHGGLVTTGA